LEATYKGDHPILRNLEEEQKSSPAIVACASIGEDLDIIDLQENNDFS
jgi:hypothetical protein